MGNSQWGSTQTALTTVHDVALLDLDGVVYVGAAAVPYAADSLAAARAVGMRCGFVTNNASRPPQEVADHLGELGIPTTAHDVVNSAQAGARLLLEVVEPGARVLYIGGPGVPAALLERGFQPVVSIRDDPAALIQGYGKNVGWEQLAQGSYALHAGLPWVATNTDRTIPTKLGRALGNGSLVAALRYATGAVPLVAGKPEPPLMIESVERMSAERPLVVGDRLDTDIAGANNSGIPSLLVLTGVTDWPELLSAPAVHRPTYLGDDLRSMDLAQPAVQLTRTAEGFLSTCRDVQIVLDCVPDPRPEETVRHWADVAQVSASTPAWLPAEVEFGEDRQCQLAGIRAVVAGAWGAMDGGLRIVAARVAR